MSVVLLIIGILFAGFVLAKLTDQPSTIEYIYDDEPEPLDELDYEPEPEPELEIEPEIDARTRDRKLAAMLAPLRQYTKPGKGPLEVYGWTVRKQENELWAVVPYDSKGTLLWSRAPYTDLTDSRLAWDFANTGRRALKWIDG